MYMTQPRKNKSFKEITELPFQTVGEEIANSILHGIGVLLAVAGLVLLTLRANGYIGGRGGGALAVTSYVIFAVTMICMFLASTLYHAIQHKGAKRVFRVLDHSAIYLLIAGTYTPFCLTALPGAWGWSLFGVEWGLAAAGITLYAVNYKPLKKIEVAVYILMGWAIVIGWIPLYRAIPRISLILLLAGGLAYTLGTIWYRKKDTRGAHVTWHVFVLIGAVCHWWSIWFMS
ncbi:PAQR family membrane homeostasis protein TrhA [Breznakiella homolactica]|nr:hemolysin III family protein [Breznakiella homolactica]